MDQSGTRESRTIPNEYVIVANSPRIPVDRFSSGQEECVTEVEIHPEYKDGLRTNQLALVKFESATIESSKLTEESFLNHLLHCKINL